MKPKVTLSNVASFLEGYSKMFIDKVYPYDYYLQEQFLYRAYLCKDDCIVNNACIFCGCNPEGKKFVKESCNKGKRFPNLMSKEEWEQFKSDKSIIKLIGLLVNEKNLRDNKN